VFWLLDPDGPPTNLFVSFSLEVVCTFWAVEQVAAIGEFANRGAVIATAYGEHGMAILQFEGFVIHASRPKIGCDMQFVQFVPLP
jgi:hypothetical protein